MSDGRKNAIYISGGTHNRFRDVDVAKVWEAAVTLDTTSFPIVDTTFFNCYFYGANVASNAFGSNTNAAGSISVVRISGVNTNGCTYNRFDGCFMGDSSGSVQNRSKYAFEWLIPLGGANNPWQRWSFLNNVYMWNTNWIGDYSPLLNATHNVTEFFGLLPQFTEAGLGGWALSEAARCAWKLNAKRVWVHTCDLDHPVALAVYRRAGFAPFRTDVMDEPDLRLTGEFPASAAPHRPVARS